MLDKQISIYSVDTASFYSGKESHLHFINHKLRTERNMLINGGSIKGSDGKVKRTIDGLKNVEKQILEYGVSKEELDLIYKQKYDFHQHKNNSNSLMMLCQRYCELKDLIALKNHYIKKSKESLLQLLSNKVEANIKSHGKNHIRTLNENQVSNKNIISVFDSYFTRTIGAKQDELCEDFLVIQVYYFDVIKDLIHHGFMYKGEKYIYFTSSAGQIRTKKTVFIKESVWNKYEKSIMCGLTIDDINQKGGNNPNKHLAYLALANSATDVWNEFNIDKTIVIDDFETDVFGTYDLVDDVDYSITRTEGYVPIAHTDGAGMMLPCMGKNRMVRLPWVKGLLGSFDFKKFIEVNNCSHIIKDIYGKEHDVIAEDIQIIFTKSMFKMWKYYDSWEQYKDMYKKYNCSTGYTNLEEDRIKDATINYQMLQTLTDITDDEIEKITKSSVDKIKNLCSSIDSIKNLLGITPYNLHKTAFQKSIELYPNLLNDEYSKSYLRSIKDSVVKKCRAGKLHVHSKYTFLLPDFYAACQYWFMNEKNPKGLLEDGEVFCWLFRKSEKLDCLRSPHLYKEHAIRKNIAWRECKKRQEQLREWYSTDAIYTSCHDLISKILQFDVDGDKALVVADKTIIEVAERNMNDIVPLYYNMKKAEPVQLNSTSIYNGLNAAFSGGNIGIYSNNISKIWNSDVFIFGTESEKKRAIDIVKLLCMENNFVIDYAKTLYKPERPNHIHKEITSFTKDALPHFFKYAKDKDEYQVSDINLSFVNKLDSVIPNPRINCRKLNLGKIDYKMLMSNPDIEFEIKFTDKGKLIKEDTNPIINKYCEFNKEYYLALDSIICMDKMFANDTFMKSALKHKRISDEIKFELSQYGYSDNEIADILVKFLYGIKNSGNKTALWICYGDIIYQNLEKHIRKNFKEVQCVDCGEWFNTNIKDSETCRCKECVVEHKRILARLRKQRQRQRQKMSDVTLPN